LKSGHLALQKFSNYRIMPEIENSCFELDLY
jgi:hypothetical protein